MVQGMGVSAGSTTLAALLLRPGLPDTPIEAVTPAPASRDRGVSDPVSLSVQARQSTDRAKHAVEALEADGARWSAAAFGWLLHQRLLDMRAAEIDPAFGSAAPVPPAPSRGGTIDLAV